MLALGVALMVAVGFWAAFRPSRSATVRGFRLPALSRNGTVTIDPQSIPAAGDAELALFAPLREGAEIGHGGRITRISRVIDGSIHLLVRKDDNTMHFVVAIAPAGDARSRGPYSVFIYGTAHPDAESLEVSELLRRALRPNVRVPPGLTELPWPVS